VLAIAAGSWARKRSRLTGGASSTSAMEKAKRRTAEWNLDSDAGRPDSFSVLDLLPDSRLSSVIADSCIVFVPSAGSPGEALSLIRAKEKVQAALAEVALHKEQEAALHAAREAAAAAMPAASEAGTSAAAAAAGSGGELRPPRCGLPRSRRPGRAPTALLFLAPGGALSLVCHG
jgi:hypothetical protein